MGLNGLEWQTVFVPLAAGLHTKEDPRALNPPGLTICRDVEFDDIGGLRTRKPYTPLGYKIVGGGNVSDVRKVVSHGDELLVFTKDSVYAYTNLGGGNSGNEAWVLKGTHLAVETSEADRFDSTADQYDADRAELGGVIVYVWTEGTGASARVYVAAIDKLTGSVTCPRTSVWAGQADMPRVVALDTKILILFRQGTDLLGRSIDPFAIDVSGGGTAVSSGSYTYAGGSYDIVKIPGVDQAVAAWMNTVTTGYSVATLTSALVQTAVNKARTCDSAIAVAVSPDALHVHVIRTSSTKIRGDTLTIALADVATEGDMGTPNHTPVLQIAAAHRDVKDSGEYRCYAYWQDQQASNLQFTGWNWINTAGALGFGGSEQTLVGHVTPASRAFAYDGHVFLWTAFYQVSSFSGANVNNFRAQLQNTYFLYRDDALLCGKAACAVAGGAPGVTGRLPGVASTDGTTFTWCGGRKRRIVLGGSQQTGYSAERVPRDITFTFDSNSARRCVRLGETLYITGAEILQYDGVGLYEVGFHIYPWFFALAAEVAAGNMAAGTYAYKMTWRWPNAHGELDRSTTATVGQVTINGTTQQRVIFDPASVNLLCQTHKTTQPPGAEMWRTAVNPTADVPFYLASSTDPATAGTAPNEYIATSPPTGQFTGFEDNYSDATLTVLQANPENGAALPNLAPPPATIIAASADRIFLGGIAGDPHRIWYSKQRADGEVAAFNDALVVAVPPAGGDITGIALLNETLVVFRERAIYTLPGDGFDNVGGGQNYGPARIISGDIGAVNAEAIALWPEGLVFKSSKGWYVLDRGWSLSYIGAGVASFDSDTVLGVHVVEKQHQIRAVTNGRVLVYDYLVKEWAEWTIGNALSACMWNGTYTLLAVTYVLGNLIIPSIPPAGDGVGGIISNGVNTEATDFAYGTGYGLDVETAWIKLNDLQGFGRVRWIMALGEYRDTHHLRIRVARDYQGDGAGGWTYYDDSYWTPSTSTAGDAEQVRHGPSRQQCQAIKIRITASSVNNDGAPPLTEGLKLTGLALEVGIKRGLYKRLPVGQKT